MNTQIALESLGFDPKPSFLGSRLPRSLSTQILHNFLKQGLSQRLLQVDEGQDLFIFSSNGLNGIILMQCHLKGY